MEKLRLSLTHQCAMLQQSFKNAQEQLKQQRYATAGSLDRLRSSGMLAKQGNEQLLHHISLLVTDGD